MPRPSSNGSTGYGIKLTCVFGGFEGESYADIPTVARTVGLVPPATRAARTKELKEIADFAKLLGCKVVGLHVGFVPHDANDPLYKQTLDVTRDVCDHCAKNGQSLHLETGPGIGRFAAASSSTTSSGTTCSSTSTRPT